jgi:uncharacterized protein (DUF4415 family)
MSPKLPKIDRKGEVGDLSELDPAIFRRLKQLPNSLQRKMRGRPKLENPKELIHIRIDADVVHAFRSTGSGWQTRINALLKKEAKKLNHA